MATLCSDLIQETRRHFDSNRRNEFNTLASAVTTTTATTVTLTYELAGIQKQALLAIDLEMLLVLDVSAATKTATVVRGYAGSTAATHTTGSLVYVNPSISDFQIFQALNAELDDLSSPMNGLFKVSTVTFTFNIATRGYDLAADVIDVLDVRYHGLGAPLKRYPKVQRWDLARGQSASDFPSGVGLLLYSYAAPGQPITVRYKAPFTHFTALTDDAQTVAQLGATMNDIPPMGAAIRLVEPTEIKRNMTENQGEPRRAGEVPPGARLRSGDGLVRRRQMRIQAEAARLMQQFPSSMRA